MRALGDVVVIVSGKGGTGKSVVTAGCGTALATTGHKVLLVDTDAGLRCLDLMLGLSAGTVYDLGDIMRGTCSPARAIQSVPSLPDLHVLAAPHSPEILFGPEAMRRLVKILRCHYDYVLIDSPAGIDKGFRIAIAAASRALVVSTPDPVCVRNAQKAASLCREEGIDDIRLVINRYRAEAIKTGVTVDLDAVIDGVGMQLIAVIPEDPQIPAYAARGEPFSGKSPAATAFENLAARLDGVDVPLMRLQKFPLF